MTEPKHETPLSRFVQDLHEHLKEYEQQILARQGSLPAIVPMDEVVELYCRPDYDRFKAAEAADDERSIMLKYSARTATDAMRHLAELMEEHGIVFARAAGEDYDYTVSKRFYPPF